VTRSAGRSSKGVRGGEGRLRRRLKVKVQSANRSAASVRWLERQLNDPYVAEAKRAGWRSRAAFKLLQLDDRFALIKPGSRIVDLGAAPGGWTQVAVERSRADRGHGCVVAIDREAMEPVAGSMVLQLDALSPEAPARILAALGGGADLVLSDMAAASTGHAKTDHLRIMGLVEAAYALAAEVLKPGGAFVAKVLRGGTERGLLDRLKRDFAAVRHVKPPASRADSAEIYVVATGFRPTADARPG
jgi:23S rRNA (uridine2552-2'-O)-methyltransferase